jgi:hypothetical protein
MNRWIAAIVTLGVIGTAGTLAFGQGEGADNQIHPFHFLENLSCLIGPDGTVTRRQISDPAVSAMILKSAKPMSANTIFFMHDGKIYMAKDVHTAGGQMLSSAIMNQPK